MENKYYTPEIEEFHVGFEYEMRDMWTDGFIKMTLTKEMLWEWRTRTREELSELQKTSEGCVGNPGADYRHEWERITTGIKDGNIRVKKLNIEDIENFGFISIGLNGWENKKGNCLMIHRDGNIILLKSRAGTCLFDGEIKNKSELKVVLKQIINE